jgi:hypothetical protein
MYTDAYAHGAYHIRPPGQASPAMVAQQRQAQLERDRQAFSGRHLYDGSGAAATSTAVRTSPLLWLGWSMHVG